MPDTQPGHITDTTGVRSNIDDLTETLLDFARKNQRADFYDLAKMSGIENPDALWAGTRTRLHLPVTDLPPIDLDAIIADVQRATIDNARAAVPGSPLYDIAFNLIVALERDLATHRAALDAAFDAVLERDLSRRYFAFEAPPAVSDEHTDA